MNEQAMSNFPYPTPRFAAEGPFAFEDFSPREQSWLRYQRWRYEKGLMTEFPGDPHGQSHGDAGAVAQLLEPAKYLARRLGWPR